MHTTRLTPSTIRRTALHGMRDALLATTLLTLTLPAGSAAAAPLNWFNGERTTGNGHITQQTRALPHFDAVKLGLAGDVELRIGNTESITVETDDNIAALIDTSVEDGTLRIRTVKSNTNIAPARLHFIVQAKTISALAVGGSGSINAASLRGSTLKFDVGGSGSINVAQLDSQSVTVQLGGSGNLQVAGSTAALGVSIGGSGNVQAGALRADTVKVSIGGSGQADVWARQSLSVSIGGSGDVRYRGEPPTVSKSVHGSGSVRPLGGAAR